MKTYPRQNLNTRHQSGAILLVVIFILGVLIASAMQFFSVATDSTKISGAARDSIESMLFTESAMEMLRGSFINNLDRDGVIGVEDCDVSGVSLDKCEASYVRKNIMAPQASLLSYMYYVSDDTAIDQTGPSLLQKLADGEAAFDTSNGQLASQKISSAVTMLRVNDLFNDDFKPLLYTVNENGLLVNSVAANWDAETSTHKAAAWFEIALNPDDNAAIDLYVQAVSQVGGARSYLQRYAGTYFDNDTLGGLVSPLAESSNINRDK
jgi:hypothetical protein